MQCCFFLVQLCLYNCLDSAPYICCTLVYCNIYFLFWACGVAVISPAPEVSWGLFVIDPDGLKILAVVHCVEPVLPHRHQSL